MEVSGQTQLVIFDGQMIAGQDFLSSYFHDHMRVSVPHIPQAILNAKSAFPQLSKEAAVARLSDFLKSGNVTVLTGAGVSVDSGIRAYRGVLV